MPLWLVSTDKNDAESQGADTFGYLSETKFDRPFDRGLSMRHFGRNVGGLESFLMYHTYGEDGRCIGCLDKLKGVHPTLKGWYFDSVASKYPTAHVSWGYRGRVDQDSCFDKGLSKKKWPDSPHNKRVPVDSTRPFDVSDEACANTRPESLAVDLFQIVDGIATWSSSFFYQVASIIEKTKTPILWGGSWKQFGDRDHFQLLVPEPKEDSDPHRAS